MVRTCLGGVPVLPRAECTIALSEDVIFLGGFRY
jgi:hypothetical protein